MVSDLFQIMLFFAGVTLVLVGISMVYLPAAVVTAGLGMLALFKEIG